MLNVDWHTVAVAAIGVLFTVLGWVWTSTMKRIAASVKLLFEKIDEHITSDTEKFASVLKEMHENHVELLKSVHTNGRNGRDF